MKKLFLKKSFLMILGGVFFFYWYILKMERKSICRRMNKMFKNSVREVKFYNEVGFVEI